MSELLAAALTFPTVVYTVLLGVSLVYWLFVLLGAFNLHLVGGDGSMEGATKGVLEGATKGVLEGATKGVLEGATKGVLEGATKGVLEGATKGVLEGATKGVLEGSAKGVLEGSAKGVLEGATKGVLEGATKGVLEGSAKSVAEGGVAGDGHSEGALASLMSALRFRKAPVTVILTFLMTFSWLFSLLAMKALTPIWPLPKVILGVLVMIASFLIALPVTSLSTRPFAKLFVTHAAKGHKDLVGRVCVVSTGTVDAAFGQASLEDGGAGLLLQIRCETPGLLKRGDRALILGWDDESGGFLVEPLEKLLDDLDEEKGERARIADAAPASRGRGPFRGGPSGGGPLEGARGEHDAPSPAASEPPGAALEGTDETVSRVGRASR